MSKKPRKAKKRRSRRADQRGAALQRLYASEVRRKQRAAAAALEYAWSRSAQMFGVCSEPTCKRLGKLFDGDPPTDLAIVADLPALDGVCEVCATSAEELAREARKEHPRSPAR